MKSTHFPCRRAALVGIVLALLPPVQRAGAAEAVTPLAPDDRYYGLTLAEWAAAHEQWRVSIPRASSPLLELDGTGRYAGVGQRLPVWFLLSPVADQTPLQQRYTRTLTLPAGQAIMFSLVSYLYAEPHGMLTETQLRDGLEGFAAGFGQPQVLEASVDGVPIPDVSRYWVRSPVHPIVLPPGNIFNEPIPAGTTALYDALVQGYYLLLPPLPTGPHVLAMRVEYSDQSGRLRQHEVTWNLTVAEP
jgi:hypothetical protein